MIYRWLADGVVLLHALFVVFVVVGGFLTIRWPRIAWVHLPAAAWGAMIEFGGWVCPLTPLENSLRERAGDAGYSGGFVEHYVLRALYPGDIPVELGWMLGSAVVLINVVAYGYAWSRRRRVK